MRGTIQKVPMIATANTAVVGLPDLPPRTGAPMPQIRSLHIYPVKSLGVVDVTRADMTLLGLMHDRRWMVCAPDGSFLTQRQHARMALIAVTVTQTGLTLHHAGQTLDVALPDQSAPQRDVTVWRDVVPCRLAPQAVSAWLSAALDRPCVLVFQHDPTSRRTDPIFDTARGHVSLADGFPILIANTASLDDLGARMNTPVPMSRFRPNIVLDGVPAWQEDTWQRIAIGSAILRIVKPCSRCVVTTIDQHTAERPDPREPLLALTQFRRAKGGVMFGQNAVIEQPGTIGVGDTVRVLEAGPSNLVP